MGWEKYKFSEFLENFRWQITEVYKDTPKLKFWWHIFKTLIGAILYSHPFVFFVLIIMLRSEQGFDIYSFIIIGLALSNFMGVLSGQIVNFRQVTELDNYIKEMQKQDATLNSYEIEDYVKDEIIIERFRRSRPAALLSDSKLGHIFKMNTTKGKVFAELKGFVISRSLGFLSPFKTQNKSYVFVKESPEHQTPIAKYKLYHELGHLTDGSFQRRHSVYHYKLVTITFILFFFTISPIEEAYLLLLFVPYFYLINKYTTERNNEYIDELCCDIFAIDMFEDKEELRELKRLVPRVTTPKYNNKIEKYKDKLENLSILPKDLEGQTTIEVLKNFIDRKWIDPTNSMSLAYISRIPNEEWILASSLLIPLAAFLLPPLQFTHHPITFTLLIGVGAICLFLITGIKVKQLERKTNTLKSMNYKT